MVRCTPSTAAGIGVDRRRQAWLAHLGRTPSAPVQAGARPFGSSPCKRPLNDSVSRPRPRAGTRFGMAEAAQIGPGLPDTSDKHGVAKKPGKEQPPARRRGRLRGVASVSCKEEQKDWATPDLRCRRQNTVAIRMDGLVLVRVVRVGREPTRPARWSGLGGVGRRPGGS